MNKEYQQLTEDVNHFISESIEQLVDRQVTNALNMAATIIMDKYQNMYKVLESRTAKEIFMSSHGERSYRLFQARQKVWAKLGTLNDVTGILLNFKNELIKK